MSELTSDDVANVARLAYLAVSDDELDEFTHQLAKVLGHFADVEALDVGDVEPMLHPYPLVNVMRTDEVGPTLERDEVLAQAPSAEVDQFSVPPNLGEAP